MIDLHELSDQIAKTFQPDVDSVIHIVPNDTLKGLDVTSADFAPLMVRVFPLDLHPEWAFGAAIHVLEGEESATLSITVRGQISERGLASIMATVI
jgi:hypothetical protein